MTIEAGALAARSRREPWTAFVDAHPAATFFHRPEWLAALAAAYPGFRPRHLVLEDDGAVTGIAPALALRNPFTGRRLTSQPFNFYGGSLARDDVALASLLDGLEREAREQRARLLDLRGTEPLPAELARAHRLEEGGQYLRSVVMLEPGADPRRRYARRFRERIGALERDMARRGASVVPLEGRAGADALHAVLTTAYGRKHGTLAQPRRLVRALVDGPAAGSTRALGLVEGERLLGAVLLGVHGARFSYLLGAARPDAEASSPIALLLDRALTKAAAAGAVELDLGISSRRHEGLRHFKSRFGAEERALFFYRHALRGRLGPPPDYHGALAGLRPIVTRMPPRLLAAISAAVAGWLG